MDRSLNDETLRSESDHRDQGDRTPKQDLREQGAQDCRTVCQLRGRDYHLSPRQSAMLRDLGAFRTITVASLQKHHYSTDEDRFRKDLRDLGDQRLVVVHRNPRSQDRYISLTNAGKNVTEVHFRANSEQALYSGIVKKRELRHDAAIYDVYQKEAQKISKAGGTIKRVVLDFEFKKNVNRELSKLQDLSPAERERQRQEIADAHGLKIVKGKLQIPDLRLEYESREQENCKVDLECVTGHYKARQIAAKAAAGFTLYNQDYRGRSAERGQDLVGEVMSI